LTNWILEYAKRFPRCTFCTGDPTRVVRADWSRSGCRRRGDVEADCRELAPRFLRCDLRGLLHSRQWHSGVSIAYARRRMDRPSG